MGESSEAADDVAWAGGSGGTGQRGCGKPSSSAADRREVRQTVLTHKELNAHNTFEQPETVVPRSTPTDLRGPELHCVLAPASVTRLDVTLG